MLRSELKFPWSLSYTWISHPIDEQCSPPPPAASVRWPPAFSLSLFFFFFASRRVGEGLEIRRSDGRERVEEGNKGFQPLRPLSPRHRRQWRRRPPCRVLWPLRCFVVSRSACFTAAYSHSVVLWPPPAGFRIRQRPFQGRIIFSFSSLTGSQRSPLCAIVPMGFRFSIYRVGRQRFLGPFVLGLRHCPRLVYLPLDLFSALLVYQLVVERERHLFFSWFSTCLLYFHWHWWQVILHCMFFWQNKMGCQLPIWMHIPALIWKAQLI